MTVWADLKSRIADELDRSDLSTQIGRELVRAVQHYERQRWWFNEAQATASTSSSQAAYAVPTDLLLIDSVEITVSTRQETMNEIGWQRYMEEYRYGTTTGSVPSDWTYYADQLWLGPVPNGVYVLNMSYVKTLGPASFTDGTDNIWTNDAEEMITARVLKTLGGRVLQLPLPQLSAWNQLERDAYMSLCAHNEQKIMTGKVRPWSG